MEAPSSDDPQDTLEAAWSALEASWNSKEAHRKFLALCESYGRLDAAGMRYRQIAESDDPRAEEAKKQIDELLVRALAKMQVLRQEPSRRPRSLVLLTAVVLMVGLLAFAASFFV